jgi:haloacetate dehalogenase
MVFDGFQTFETFDVETAATMIHGRQGGAGPPVLLLHGTPETHLMWHRVAPRLAERHTVVATDLRGYGDSGAPPSTPDHAPYSMRAIAAEQVEVMRSLGFETFSVVGHNRGARCAFRLALDHPDVVTHLAVLDILPTGDIFNRADKQFSLGFWHWSFMAAPEPVPELMIGAAPEIYVNNMLDEWSDSPGVFSEDVRAEYIGKFRDPATVHAICEQYRAAATLDHEHDEADRRSGRKLACPTLALWSRTSAVANHYDAMDIWKSWADDLEAAAITGGHFLPEEAPDETGRRLLAFLG